MCNVTARVILYTLTLTVWHRFRSSVLVFICSRLRWWCWCHVAVLEHENKVSPSSPVLIFYFVSPLRTSAGGYQAFIGRYLPPQSWQRGRLPVYLPVCLPSCLIASVFGQLEQLHRAGFEPRTCKVSTPCFTALTDTLIWHAMSS